MEELELKRCERCGITIDVQPGLCVSCANKFVTCDDELVPEWK